MQPSHDIDVLNFAPDRFDDKHLNYSYPWQQLINRGLMILGGFDASIKLNPRIKFYTAMTSKRLDEILGEGW
jgi:predicted amidohydrolase YtcJ